MNVIVCREPGHFELQSRPVPTPGPGEALLRIRRVGICGTDLHAYAGRQAYFTYPRILGHELSAEIEAIGDGTGLAVGDRVIVMPYIHCGNCIACRAGKTNCCRHMRVLGVHADGGMQQRIVVPVDLLLAAGPLSHDETAIVEPLAIGAHALRRAAATAGETVVVVGCGPIGIGLLALARLRGCRVIGIDTNTDRLAFAREAIDGVETVVGGPDAVARVTELTDGELAPVVFDATGHPAALESGVRYLAHGGRYVLVGLSRGDLTFNHPEIHAKETSLLCSRNATRDDFIYVRDQLAEGRFPTDRFITHSVHYSELIGHFDAWLRPETGVVKAMVHWDDRDHPVAGAEVGGIPLP
ncbi:zinc-binding alcohol dehydrogenase family protein [Lewinella sp. IMCC34183]|uniref:zinc-binding alcohol dehydrogenase family protein n=1 Tax=Lewinella sp. IMCC34183 TaxID=2248762 RepID=UPI000E26AC1C|nr:zinc-binding alcohol dehydrogenase family protein [Lewinella sp. IMCC34183]